MDSLQEAPNPSSRHRHFGAVVPARPVKVRPHLDPKPWGGRRLADWGIALPEGETIGEAHLAAPEATVVSGPQRGLTLRELALQDPGAWIGARGLEATGGRLIFPLLVKLIDGQADLSIQVHPDDRAAAAAGLGTGKTEAYHILTAQTGSVIYLGLKPGASESRFAAACRLANGSAAGLLRQIRAEEGMTILIPAGTIHALGAGITLYEIQQPSNVTFRLDDWGRRDASGMPRPLHHDEGLAVLDPRSRPEPIPPVVLDAGAGPAGRLLLVATRYFALERLALGTNDVARIAATDSPQVLTCLFGAAILDASGWALTMTAGETVIVPAGTPAMFSGSIESVILRGWVPDLERDIIAPARMAGASETSLHRLVKSCAEPPSHECAETTASRLPHQDH
ncbi:MAG: class I mannose-6-phosphate isomerase [Thermomicrobiales bacterium]